MCQDTVEIASPGKRCNGNSHIVAWITSHGCKTLKNHHNLAVSVNGVSTSSYFHALKFKCRKGVLIRQTIDLPTNTGGFIHCSLGIHTTLDPQNHCLCIYKGNTMVPILNKQLSREEQCSKWTGSAGSENL